MRSGPAAPASSPLRKTTSASTLPKMLQYHRIAAVAHGFRSSFRDWAAEETDHPREVIEAALAHVVQNKVEAAYARSDLFERRRRLMDDSRNAPGTSLDSAAGPPSRPSPARPSATETPASPCPRRRPFCEPASRTPRFAWEDVVPSPLGTVMPSARGGPPQPLAARHQRVGGVHSILGGVPRSRGLSEALVAPRLVIPGSAARQTA